MKKIGWWGAGLALVLTAAAPLHAQTDARAGAQVQVSVGADGTVTVSPSTFKLGKGQTSFVVAMRTQGYTITGISFSTGAGLFDCTPQGNSATLRCTLGNVVPGGSAEYKLSIQGSGGTVDSPPSIFIQSD